MDFIKDELHIINQLSKGYVLPITEHNKDLINQLIKKSFTLEKKSVKLIKNYSIDLEDIFCATLDSRFDIKKVS